MKEAKIDDAIMHPISAREFVTVGVTFGTKVAGASTFGLSTGKKLIAKGLRKMAEAEKKEKEKENTETEILNDYWKAIKAFSDRRFTLNAPIRFAFRSKDKPANQIKHFIGEEQFAFKGAEGDGINTINLSEFYIVDAITNSVTSDYIITTTATAKDTLDGFTGFYNDAFDYANEKTVKETRKEAKEKEEEAYEKALKPVIDDPLFGSW